MSNGILDPDGFPVKLYERCAKCGFGWAGPSSRMRCANCDNLPYWSSDHEQAMANETDQTPEPRPHRLVRIVKDGQQYPSGKPLVYVWKNPYYERWEHCVNSNVPTFRRIGVWTKTKEEAIRKANALAMMLQALMPPEIQSKSFTFEGEHFQCLPDEDRSQGLNLDPETKARLESFNHYETDARKWAELFSEVFRQNPHAAADKDYLLSIFATAIQAGSDGTL